MLVLDGDFHREFATMWASLADEPGAAARHLVAEVEALAARSPVPERAPLVQARMAA
jgi:hypothetical protein